MGWLRRGAPLLAWWGLACAAEAPPAPLCGDCNLVLVSLDTLRADHLGAYGYGRDTSPALDRFASRAIRFDQAFASSRKTAPSHASMFTALHPSVHGVFMNDARAGGMQYRLDPRVPTLPDLLAKVGFETVAWHGGGNVSKSYGFARGFSRYVPWARYRARRGESNEWRPAFRWLEERGDGRFFLFLHTYSIHDPYQPPPPYDAMFSEGYAGKIRSVPTDKNAAARFWANVDPSSPDDVQHLVDRYDGGIRFADEHLVEPLLDRLERSGRLEDTVVVFVSDHGEEFMEHGNVLHEQLYDEVLRVPLLVYLPPRATGGRALAGVRNARVSLVDLTPTLLSLLGVDHDPDDFQGRSLVPVIAGAEDADRSVFAEGLMARWGAESLAAPDRLQTTLRTDDHKLYRRELEEQNVDQLFDLSLDPDEQENLSERPSAALDRMRAALEGAQESNRRFRARRGYATEKGEFEPALVDELRALGYVE